MQSENDLCMSMECVKSMFYDIDLSLCCILARQVQSENDLCMSMECVESMFDDIDLSRYCILAGQEPSENDLRVSLMYLFLCFMNKLMTKP